MESDEVEWFDRPIGEAVEIVEANDGWAQMGAQWEHHITRALPGAIVDHVGSTSVPHLAAKPVIDLQVQVPDLADEATYVAALATVGLILRARGDDFRFFRFPADLGRSVHVHVCEVSSDWALDHLAFRDALRGDLTLAEAYENLKRRLARSATDRTAYTAGKTEFIANVVAQARSRRME